MRRIPLPLGIFGELPLHCFRWAIWEHKRNAIFPQGSRGRDPGGKRDLRPSGVNNGYAIIVRPETAKAMNLKTPSDLAKVAATLKLGAGPEFGVSTRYLLAYVGWQRAIRRPGFSPENLLFDTLIHTYLPNAVPCSQPNSE